jgi:hypothetical protein
MPHPPPSLYCGVDAMPVQKTRWAWSLVWLWCFEIGAGVAPSWG